jgi:hypothetical protein
MKQSVLDRRVATATGESVHFIRQRGFSLLIPPISTQFERALRVQRQAATTCQRQTARTSA